MTFQGKTYKYIIMKQALRLSYIISSVAHYRKGTLDFQFAHHRLLMNRIRNSTVDVNKKRFQTAMAKNEQVKLTDIKLQLEKERKEFDAVFPSITEDLVNMEDLKNCGLQDAEDWLKKVLIKNVPFGKRNRGLSVVTSYKLFMKPEELTKENIKLAHILGWCVEMTQAFLLLMDDVMDQSYLRRGMPCWFRQKGVGLMAINDAVLIESGIYYLLKMYFSKHPFYVNILETFHQVIKYTAFGQCLDMLSTQMGQRPKFELFTDERYAAIVRYKTAFYSFLLPVKLGLYLAGWTNETHHKAAEKILLKIGHFFQVQDDYLDCFGDPTVMGKKGTDIEDGKCTWLIVLALKRVSDEQKNILMENYGLHEESAVNKVKEIYNQLELASLYDKFEEETFEELKTLINDITSSSEFPAEVFHALMKVIYKRKK